MYEKDITKEPSRKRFGEILQILEEQRPWMIWRKV